jgi:hypothetical protein
MAIRGLSAEAFENRLRSVIRPSRPVDRFEVLVDRSAELARIEEAVASPGRHVFIYGERGAGKTSLAHTAAYKHESAYSRPVFCACGRQTSFASIVRDATEQLLARPKAVATELTRDVGVAGGFFTAKASLREVARALPEHIDLNTAVALLQEATAGRRGRAIVVIDEFENLESAAERVLFSELVKQLSDRDVPVALIFCGVGRSIGDLLQAHLSAHRYLEGVRLPTPPLSFDGRDALVRMAAETLGVAIDDDVVLRISRVSDGFPHYVHLLCQKLFWLAHRVPHDVECIDVPMYRQAVSEAVDSAEAHLRLAYERAVLKDRDDYREVLWAVADRPDDDRNIQRVYAESYLRIMLACHRIPLELAEFQGCVARLRSEPYGAILVNRRRGWTGFREAIMRGYVRLMAEHAGVAIAL